MTASILNSEDPELGTVRLCRSCGETWPLDGEFWYFDRRGQVQGYCKACWSERRHQTATPRGRLTVRQIEVIHAVRAHGGNRSRAARALGVTTANVQQVLHDAGARGAALPPAIGGRKGRPDLGQRVRRAS